MNFILKTIAFLSFFIHSVCIDWLKLRLAKQEKLDTEKRTIEEEKYIQNIKEAFMSETVKKQRDIIMLDSFTDNFNSKNKWNSN